MAIKLSAVLSLKDNFTPRLRNVARGMQSMDRAMDYTRDKTGKLRDSLGRFVTEGNRSGNAAAKAGSSFSALGRNAGSAATSIGSLKSGLLGLVGAYASVQGAEKLFGATVVNAAQREQSTVTISAMFDDAKLSKQYMELMDKIAIESPVLDSQEMYGNSKSFITASKDLGQLEKMWSLAERMAALDPAQGTSGAVFALRELFSGDAVSMVERFEMPRGVMNDIKNLSLDEQLESLDKYFKKVGLTEGLIEKMGDTTLGKWQQVKEQTSLLFAQMGKPMLAPISKGLEWLLGKFDSGAFNGIAKSFSVMKAAIISLAPVLKVFAVFGTVVATILTASLAFSAISAAVSFLLSPLGLVAMGITGLVYAFQYAYKESASFRSAIDSVVGKVKELFSIVTGDGSVGAKFSGILSALGLSPETVTTLVGYFTSIKTAVTGFVSYLVMKFAEMKPGLQSLWESLQSAGTLIGQVFTSLLGYIQPIISGIGSALKILGDIAVMVFNNIIAPAVSFLIKAFQTAWILVGPILKLLGATIANNFAVLKVVWDTILKPVAAYLTGQFKQALDSLSPVLDVVGKAFSAVGDRISKVADWVANLKSTISKFKPPSWLTKLGGGVAKFVAGPDTSKVDGHAFHGERFVPRDRMNYTLHKGERVLTAKQNKEYSAGGKSISVAKLADQIVVREEADIDRITDKLVRKLQAAGGAGA